MKIKFFKEVRIMPVLLIFIIGISVLLLLVGTISVSAVNELTNEIITAKVGEYVNKTNDVATTTAGVVSFLATVVRDNALEPNPSREKVIDMISHVLMDNDDLLMVWTCWEPDAFDGLDAKYAGTEFHDETGRFIPYLVKKGDSYKAYALHDYDDPVIGEYYQGPMSTGELYISEPYYYSTGDDELLLYSVAMPIEIDGKLCGVVGADVSIDTVNSIMDTGRILDDGFLFTITAAGTILTYPGREYVMTDYRETALSEISGQIERALQGGGSFFESLRLEYLKEDVLLNAVTYRIGNGQSYWMVCGVVPIREVYASASRLIGWVAICGIMLGIVVILVVRYVLATKDLQLERDAAVNKELAKSSFLANMSHEIRTPLSAIIGMTKIGRLAPAIEKKDYAFEKIEDASGHLLGVINDILDMSKIEANKFLLTEEEFVFEKMLQKVVSVTNFRIHEKEQNFSVIIDNAIPHALIGDSQRLAQVITNLLSNAAKFTPEQGSIRLDARLTGEKDGVCALQIDIIDTGIGIPPERQSCIFDSFEQAESSTSRKYGGTGLGLTISKCIVEEMGGSIWLKSEPGKGSTFSFSVNLRRGKQTPEFSKSTGLSWKNARALVVDDEPSVREYFTSIAEHLGLKCDTASGGVEALSLLETDTCYNIFFVDWQMPDMDGIRLSAEIKSRVSGQSVIIMISAFDWANIEADAKKAGVDRFLPKPLFPSLIVDCLNDCLGIRNLNETSLSSAASVSFRGRRIMLAEDIEINREILATLLGPTQVVVDFAENGVEALNMFTASPELYDLIFMDVHMPEMDGLEATRRIRSLGFPKASEIPIIAMTANVFREDVERCKAAGMNDHIGKPLDVEEIISKTKVWLK